MAEDHGKEHEHHFPLRTRWHHDRQTGMYYQTIVGRKDCECGLSWTRYLVERYSDPVVNAKAALAYIRDRHPPSPWVTKRSR